MFRFFCNQRYFKFFFDINGKNIKELSKKHGTISHLSVVTDQLKKEGLITKVTVGREVDIKLTEKGEEFKKILRTFDNFATKQMEIVKKEELEADK